MHKTVAATGCFTSSQARIAVVSVAVVTALARVDHAVATASQSAVVAAGVHLPIAVKNSTVAGFYLGLHKTVAAARDFAVSKAGIAVISVPIVAALARVDHAVTAAGQRAIDPAGVSVVVTVINASVTGFNTFLHETIAAGGQLTAGQAGAHVVATGIVAALARVDHAVATAGQRAIVAAGVGLLVVIVCTRVAGFYFNLDETVAAESRPAADQASIKVVGVAIVANLAHIGHAITAGSSLAVSPTGVGQQIAVGHAPVAAFYIQLDEAVAAGSSLAAREARIAVVGVAVVAALVAVCYPIATTGRRAVATAGVGLGIAVIYTSVTSFYAGLHKAIAASRGLAVSQAGIAVV